MNHSPNTPAQGDRADSKPVKKAYTPPEVTEHGSLEAITKGGVDPMPSVGWIS